MKLYKTRIIINTNKLIIICTILLTSSLSAQNKKNSLQIEIGKSTHGTSDAKGIAINSEYNHYFSQQWSYTIGLGATINDGEYGIMYVAQNGDIVDSSYRYDTSGIQLSGKLGWSFIRTKKNDLGLRLGSVIRYQTSSYFDELSVYYQLYPNQPVPLITLVNTNPQRTLAIGGILQLYYNYDISSKIYIGTSTCLQTDSNGDTITQLSAGCGMRF